MRPGRSYQALPGILRPEAKPCGVSGIETNLFEGRDHREVAGFERYVAHLFHVNDLSAACRSRLIPDAQIIGGSLHLLFIERV